MRLPLETNRPRSAPLRGAAGVVLATAVLAAGRSAAADSGEQIYRSRCASCHGDSGQGVAGKHDKPLLGDKSVLQLARYIEKSMPDDKPGTCTGDDALAVARFVHESFYSPVAQARNRPPRIELSHLTVRQYQNAVMDLVGSFRAPARVGEERGLHGEYFDARQPGGKRVLDRIDPQVLFDFERGTPSPEGLAKTGFAARWTGSLLAPDTGEYEILVRTDKAARLWLNDLDRPLIDAWVKSGNDTEYRASAHLLGGRAYAIKLELSSRKQGVDDKDKQKDKKPDEKPVECMIQLCWKPPKRILEPVPARNLAPETVPEVFVPRTAFPPDDRSAGYERGTSVSKAWDEASTEAAIEVAGYIGRHLAEVSGARKDAADRDAKVRQFLRSLVERAFRHPIDAAEQELYIDRQLGKAADLEAAGLEATVKRVVILALKSPRFLFVELGGRPVDAWTIASRLSFALWDSIPDGPLVEAAAAGRLGTRDEVVTQAERMLRDPRARSKLRQFFLQWLKVEGVPDLAKDSSRFPDFGEALASDLRTSLDLFLEDALWGERSDFRKLLLSDEVFMNGRLGRRYGFDLPEDAPFQKLHVDRARSAGLISHPYLMARFAYTDSSSPIHRGVFVVRSVLGRGLRPPPEAAAPIPPSLHPDLTTRERVSLQTEPKPCQGCHEMINPLGFALENFDAIGRFRTEEKGKPIDATGYYEGLASEKKTFRGARELAEMLASSDEVHASFVSQLFHYTVKQPLPAYGPETAGELGWVFSASCFDIRELLSEIATTAALSGLPFRGKPEVLRQF